MNPIHSMQFVRPFWHLCFSYTEFN